MQGVDNGSPAAMVATDVDDLACEDSALTFESSASCLHDVVDDSGAVVHRTFRARSSAFRSGSACTSPSPPGIIRARSFVVQKLDGSPPPQRKVPRSATKHRARPSWRMEASTARSSDDAGRAMRGDGGSGGVVPRATFRDKAIHLSVMLPSDLDQDGPGATPSSEARLCREPSSGVESLQSPGNPAAELSPAPRGAASSRKISFALGLKGHKSMESEDNSGNYDGGLDLLDGADSDIGTLLTMLPGAEDTGVSGKDAISPCTQAELGQSLVWGGDGDGTRGGLRGGEPSPLEPPAAPRGDLAQTMRLSERFAQGCRGLQHPLKVINAVDVPARLRRPSVWAPHPLLSVACEGAPE